MNKKITELLPPLLIGEKLDNALKIEPEYREEIRNATEPDRLVALQDLYNIFIPTKMGREIYTKLYLALHHSLAKKQSLIAVRQFSENQRKPKERGFNSIIGGADSFTIIGESGIGKSATVSRVIDLISSESVLEESSSVRIIPCVQVQTPADCSVKGLLLEILRMIDEILDTRYYYNAMRAHATVDMLIGSVSNVALNHCGMLVVDEIQNIVNAKSGKTIVGMLTQLINSAGISIAMVGTPESSLFFGQEMMLARRSVGLSYGPFHYDEEFVSFCNYLFRYQYVRNKSVIDEKTTHWLFLHSGGNASVVISLLHDAQEIAIMSGYETLDICMLEQAYERRLSLMHDFLYKEPLSIKKNVKKEKAVSINAKNVMLDDLIVETVNRAKRLKKDLAEELQCVGIKVLEVAI